jgi:multisubunit Na+/H+ antiporter MnhB subunit
MNIEGIYSVALLLLIVAVADFVIMAREHFAATVGFVAYGLLIALAWMGLSAPDVALTEAAVGGGVTGALLLGACAGLRGANDPDERPRLIERGAALVLSVGITAALIGVMLLLPEPAPTLAPSAKESLGSTGLANAVTAVLMVYRALDTMLEKVVLLLALVAVWSLAADRFWEDVPPSGFLRSQADH